ncbi:MAG: sigma-70 family RNA polymerase sigma factor [Granulosicoccaceae bacterium]|jgi:RNA polymerase sigma-70 factor (ECF subfamily)
MSAAKPAPAGPRDAWSDSDDLGLMTALGQGDKQAFTEFARRHMPGMLGFARRYLASSEAEDVVQEAFTRVWLKAGQWQERGVSPRSWLIRIVYNLCMDTLRRRHDEDEQALAGLADTAAGPAQQHEQDVVHAQLMQALRALPERQRSALTLTVYHALSNRETADVLGISIDALESLLSRGRRHLKDILQQNKVDSYE